MNVSFDFTGKVAVITGGASGIGLEVARAFTKAGAAVTIADINKKAAEQCAAELREQGFKAIGVGCDVASVEDAEAMVEATVKAFGHLDIAYNNAGMHAPVSKTAEAGIADFQRVIAVNLFGEWNCMRAELKQMLKQGNGGAIVNCSSQSGLVGTAGLGAYTASKHGIIGMTKCAALEYAREGIRINVVCPGTSDTPMVQAAAAANPEHMKFMIDTIPAGRMGRAEEIASAVLWLCSEGAGFMVGQTVAPEGGFTIC